MAKHYKKTPSEILNIEDEYLGYCINEVAYFLEINALDNKGRINWGRIKWKDEVVNNEQLISFIQKGR